MPSRQGPADSKKRRRFEDLRVKIRAPRMYKFFAYQPAEGYTVASLSGIRELGIC